MKIFSNFLILYFLFLSNKINCRQKSKKKIKTKNNPQSHVPLADSIRPSDISKELFCDACHAFFIEAIKNLRNLNKESDVTFYLNNRRICAQENFKGYHFSTPEMEIGCEVLIGEYYDEVQQILIERNPHIDTNETLVRKFCYRKIKACNGVDLSRYKPIEHEIINGELYDLEPVEEVYRVTPKITEIDYNNTSDIFNETNNNNNTEL